MLAEIIDDSEMLKRIIPGDETSVYSYDIETYV